MRECNTYKRCWNQVLTTWNDWPDQHISPIFLQLQQQVKVVRLPRSQITEDAIEASGDHGTTAARRIDMSDLDEKPVKEGKVKFGFRMVYFIGQNKMSE